MQEKVEKCVFALHIMAVECVAVTDLHYEVNLCDRQSLSFQTVLSSQMRLGQMVPNWIFLSD